MQKKTTCVATYLQGKVRVYYDEDTMTGEEKHTVLFMIESLDGYQEQHNEMVKDAHGR